MSSNLMIKNLIDYSQKLEDDYPNETAYWHLQKLRNEMQRVEILTLQNVAASTSERPEGLEDSSWWCPNCKVVVEPHDVTNDERHGIEDCMCLVV